MRMKKMLAVLAAISLLASMGISAAAEDEAVTTTVTTAEETVTTTATETTAATEATTATETTTATEETTAETTTGSEMRTTVATEENVAVGKQEIHSGDTVTFTGTLSYRIDKNRPVLDLDAPMDIVCFNDTDLGMEETITYVRLNDESLSYEEGARLTVTGTVMMAFAGTSQYVIFLENMIIKEDSVTPTETVTEEMLYNKFVAAYGKPVSIDYGDFNNDGELDAYCTYPNDAGTVNTYLVTKNSITYAGIAGDTMGANDFAYFECNGYRFRANLRTRIPVAYAIGSLTIDRIEADGTLKTVNFGVTVLEDEYGMNSTPNFLKDLTTDEACDVSSYFSSNGNMITVTHYLYNDGRNVGSTNYVYDAAKNAFVEADSEQEKTFTVEIPTSYVTAVCGMTGEPITESNYKNSMVVSCTDITGCTNGKASIVSNGSFVAGFTVKDAKPGTITITGTTGTFSSHEDPSINTSHGQCGAAGNPDTFTVTVTIDENGNIVTGGSNNGGSSNDGKTDSGSTTSNKPSTNNTTGTPKTGDVATLPAVALGLTMTAAGIAAIIYKKRK